jgi:hypothetical protein
MSAPDPSLLDLQQILQRVFDEAAGKLRTSATASIGDITVSVDLSPTDDGVYIADKDTGNKLVVNGDGSINVTFLGLPISTTPSIRNISLPTAGVESIIVLPVGTKQFELRIRDNYSVLNVAYALGESATNYRTISRGCNYSESDLNLTTLNRTLFVQANKNSSILECIIWI